jgi:hypothetical protein
MPFTVMQLFGRAVLPEFKGGRKTVLERRWSTRLVKKSSREQLATLAKGSGGGGTVSQDFRREIFSSFFSHQTFFSVYSCAQNPIYQP